MTFTAAEVLAVLQPLVSRIDTHNDCCNECLPIAEEEVEAARELLERCK